LEIRVFKEELKKGIRFQKKEIRKLSKFELHIPYTTGFTPHSQELKSSRNLNLKMSRNLNLKTQELKKFNSSLSTDNRNLGPIYRLYK